MCLFSIVVFPKYNGVLAIFGWKMMFGRNTLK